MKDIKFFKKYYPTSYLFSELVVVAIVTIVLYMKVGGDLKYVLPFIVIHFIYMHKDYRIEINNDSISLFSMFNGSSIIAFMDIVDIRIMETKILQSIFGPTRIMIITTTKRKYRFDIHKFRQENIIEDIKNHLSQNQELRFAEYGEDY